MINLELGVGKYRLDRAPHYIILAQMKLLEGVKAQMTPEQYKAALKTKPMGLPLFVRELRQCPENWDPDLFGKWPTDGLLIVYAKFPSANRSITDT